MLRPMRPPAHVSVQGLCFTYAHEQTPIFDDFNWQVAQGEMWALVGPSGCGKTTLLYLIAGLRQPSAGTVQVGGYPVPRPRASTGLILQDHGLLPWATVRANATLGLRIGHFYRHKRGPADQPRPYPNQAPLTSVDGWLERLGIAHLADKYPAQLSGGQRQRVAIARALALQPDLLLMDEPFSALDVGIRADLQDLVAALHRELGITVLIVTHNVDEAAFLGERILLLGQPPNRAAQVIEHPTAGIPGTRDTPEFATLVRTLQAHINAPRAYPTQGGQP